MSDPAEASGPFAFCQEDLAEGRLLVGVGHTLADFRAWAGANPGLVEQHVDRCTEQLREANRPAWRRRALARVRQRRELVHFSVFNLAEVPSPESVAAITTTRLPSVREVLGDIDDRHGAAGVVAALERHLPALRGTAGAGWLAERLEHLHRILPDAVVRAGGMGKVVRAATGVLLIAAHSGRADLADVVRGAYGLGAAYAIVDDTLHDGPGRYLRQQERERLHELIMKGLATGEPADLAEVPEHPLAEELHAMHGWLLEDYPFDAYRHLYHAAEAMYLAQHRDAGRTAAGPEAMYPDMFVKAGMSRVIANLLARRQVDDGFYGRCINTIFISQLRDDIVDAAEDERAGRRTATRLDDLFAYQAYVAEEVYGGDPVAADALAYYTTTRLSRAEELRAHHTGCGAVQRFLDAATGRPARADVAEQRLRERTGRVLSSRAPTAVDCRTFIADRVPYVNSLLDRLWPASTGDDLDAVVGYALAGSAKRLRPALGLMLAEGLGVDPETIEPVLVAGELFHTASLIFDDLPAQDGATLRRGRPALHMVYGEASAQLAALSMISSAFGLVAQLDRSFPASRVTRVIDYVGSVLGPAGLCRGQHLDLRLNTTSAPAAIIEMYGLKTSTAIEASLVPLLMLLDRPPEQVEELKRFAFHAGVVFQLHDDVLDATSSTGLLGKDAGNDTAKANIVRTCGLAEARRLTAEHLTAAVGCCDRLPFDTDLLACAARHFATRRH